MVLGGFVSGLGVLADVAPEKSSSASWEVIVAIVAAVLVAVVAIGYVLVRRRRSQ